MQNNWCDSNKIIFVSYHKGAGGFALRYLLGLSPDTDVKLFRHTVRSDGAAHHMLRRNSVKLDSTQQDIIRFDKLAQEIESSRIFDPKSWPAIALHVRSRLSTAVSLNDQYMADIVDEKQVILADHLPTELVKLIFPNAIKIRLYKPSYHSMKDFYIKNLLQDPSYDNWTIPSDISANTTLDAILKMQGILPTSQTAKDFLRNMLDLLCREINLMGNDCYQIHASKIFSTKSWSNEYIKLITHCGLLPNLHEADRFIDRYCSRQFNRSMVGYF
jgi:hypothetical protein